MLDFGDCDLDAVDREGVGFEQEDAARRRTGGEGRDLGLDVIKRGRDADGGIEAQAVSDDVLAVEGVAVVEDRTGRRDQRGVGVSGDTAEEDVDVSVEADVASGGDEAAVVVLRDRAGGGDEVDRAGAGGADVGSRRKRNVLRADQRDMAGRGFDVGIGSDAGVGTESLNEDVAGAVGANNGVVGGRAAVVERDVTVERAEDDCAITGGRAHVAEIGGGVRRRGAVGENLGDGEHDRVDYKGVGLENEDAAGSGAHGDRVDRSVEVVEGCADAESGFDAQTGGVDIDQGGTGIEDGTGGGDDLDRARGGVETGDGEIVVGRVGYVTAGGGNGDVVGHLHGAGDRADIDVAARGEDVAVEILRDVFKGDDGDVATRGEQAGVEDDIAADAVGTEENVTRIRGADADVVGGDGAVRDGDGAERGLKDDGGVFDANDVALGSVGDSGEGAVCIHILDRDLDRADRDGVAVDDVEPGGADAGRDRGDIDVEGVIDAGAEDADAAGVEAEAARLDVEVSVAVVQNVLHGSEANVALPCPDAADADEAAGIETNVAVAGAGVEERVVGHFDRFGAAGDVERAGGDDVGVGVEGDGSAGVQCDVSGRRANVGTGFEDEIAGGVEEDVAGGGRADRDARVVAAVRDRQRTANGDDDITRRSGGEIRARVRDGGGGVVGPDASDLDGDRVDTQRERFGDEHAVGAAGARGERRDVGLEVVQAGANVAAGEQEQAVRVDVDGVGIVEVEDRAQRCDQRDVGGAGGNRAERDVAGSGFVADVAVVGCGRRGEIHLDRAAGEDIDGASGSGGDEMTGSVLNDVVGGIEREVAERAADGGVEDDVVGIVFGRLAGFARHKKDVGRSGDGEGVVVAIVECEAAVDRHEDDIAVAHDVVTGVIGEGRDRGIVSNATDAGNRDGAGDE